MTILTIQRRFREVGRIRIGKRTEKGHPTKIKVFRLTSVDQRIIQAAARLYGGKPQQWDAGDGRPQWEVYTETNDLPVAIPPRGFGTDTTAISQWYEEWSGGGALHRCDGQWDTLADRGRGGECACGGLEVPDHARTCRPVTRLGLFLYEIPGFGLWRLETKSGNAARELGTAVEMCEWAATNQTRLPARLRLEERAQKRPDPRDPNKRITARFMVPVIDIDVTIGDLGMVNSRAIAHQEALGELAPPASPSPGDQARAWAPELPEDTGRPRSPRIGSTDLEVSSARGPVDDDLAPPALALAAGSTPAPSPPQDDVEEAEVVDDEAERQRRRRARIRLRVEEVLGKGDEKRHGAIAFITGGRTDSSSDVTQGEHRLLEDLLDEVHAGAWTATFDEAGRMSVEYSGGLVVMSEGELLVVADDDLGPPGASDEGEKQEQAAGLSFRTVEDLKRYLKAEAGMGLVAALRAVSTLGDDAPANGSDLRQRPDLVARIVAEASS